MKLTPQPYMAEQIADDVFWVGAIDWNLTDFHGYKTERGSTYNAYLILADKVTLIDTVKKPYKQEMLTRIASVIDPATIDYIVSNHSEMDHSGSLIEVIDQVQPARVFASANGVKALQKHFHHDKTIEAVENGGTLSLGNMSLQFVETKMIHWPDSMITFLPERKVLFSQDAFGMHLASTSLFADEVPDWILEWEVQKYYANIVMPYSAIVGKALAALRELNLPIAMIAPDHGPIWRTPGQIEWILGLYDKYVAQKPNARAIVIYDTMWQSTDQMARAIAGGLKAAGVEAKVMPLSGAHRSDVATEVLDAGALIVGSCTMNNQIFPTVADVLTYLKGLKPINLVGATFGSYGWSMNAVKDLDTWLEEMKIETVAEPVRVNYVPTKDDLMQCRELGATVGRALRERVNRD